MNIPFANLHYETYDKAYFPSKGVKFHGSYSLNTDNFIDYKDETPFSIVSGSFEGVVPITSRFAMIPSVSGRLIFGKNIPFSKMNVMGGDTMEQYLPDQLAFTGSYKGAVVYKKWAVGTQFCCQSSQLLVIERQMKHIA